MKGEVPVASESTAAVAVKDARRGKVLYLWPARGLETAVQEASGSKEGAREAMAEEEKGKVLTFTKYQDLQNVGPGVHKTRCPGKSWVDPKCVCFRTHPKLLIGRPGDCDWLREELYDRAGEPTAFEGMVPVYRTPLWKRVWWKVKTRLPRIHLGPCDHRGCE